PERSYTKSSPDGKFIFVMIRPAHGHPEYAKSGLYRKGDSKKPLWTVDWYASSNREKIFVASDGEHVLPVNDWPEYQSAIGLKSGMAERKIAEDDLDQQVIGIYVKGKLRGSIKLKEVVDRVVGFTATGMLWIKTEAFDDAKLTYRVDTKDGKRIVVDLKTG